MGESSKWYEYVKRLGKVVDRSNLGTDDGRRKNYGEKLFTNMFAGGKILGLEHGRYYFIVVEVHGIYSTIIEV